MNPTILLAVMIAYLGIAGQYALLGRWGLALTFLGYSIAQIGFVLDAR